MGRNDKVIHIHITGIPSRWSEVPVLRLYAMIGHCLSGYVLAFGRHILSTCDRRRPILVRCGCWVLLDLFLGEAPNIESWRFLALLSCVWMTTHKKEPGGQAVSK